jgi:hypothetical protein
MALPLRTATAGRRDLWRAMADVANRGATNLPNEFERFLACSRHGSFIPPSSYALDRRLAPTDMEAQWSGLD